MSLWIMLIIMLVSGILGGMVNFLLPANNPEAGKFINPLRNCLLLGLGATLLVPLFLEIAQSKLMDDIRFSWNWKSLNDNSNSENNRLSSVKDTVSITNLLDSSGKKIIKSDTVEHTKGLPENGLQDNVQSIPINIGKNYLLWAAYCLLAAASGFKFINMVINNVVKDEKLNQQKNKIGELEKEKEKRVKNSQISQKQEDDKIRNELVHEKIRDFQDNTDVPATERQLEMLILPVLPPIIHPDDPQKGRFGGKASNNDRKISATVSGSIIPGYYKVEITVETTNPNNPLNSEVIFYLHDSFSPSVYSVKPQEFKSGKAVDDEILSFGAFTIGVITDNGKTMLELDLAEDKSFPKEFRER
jgi:hypothetical protein